MPATDPKNTPAPAPANDSPESKTTGLLAHFWAFTPQAQRFLFWAIVSIALTCGMRAATRFLEGPKPDAQADGTTAAGGTSSGSGGGGWWNPSSGSVDATAVEGASPGMDVPPPSSPPSGSSIIPIDPGSPFSSDPLNPAAPAPIGSGSSREAYAILGLGTGSGSRQSNASVGLSSSSSSVLHFSMAGDLNLVPTDNLAAGGLSANFVAVPEPSIGGLLVMALAGLALKRHRKPQFAA